jgi:transposase
MSPLPPESILNPAPPSPAAAHGPGPILFRKSRKSRKPRRAAQDPTAGLPVLHPNAAAIDIGAAEHWGAIPPGRAAETVRGFGCCTADLEALADWLQAHGVDTVVMEATGNYWVVLYDLLETRGLHPVVVNPRYAKNMTGKKGDIPDCQWMQKLHTYGLFSNSFRPTAPVRVLRTYLRQRESLVAAASQCVQHLQKALTEMNLQVANVLSDVSGETGLRIIDAILGGERDPERLAARRDRRIQASAAQLARALRGHWKDEELFVLEQARLSYSHYQEQIAQCDERIQAQLRALESRAPEPKAAAGAGAAPAAPPVTAPVPAGDASPAAPEPFKLRDELKRILGVDLTRVPGLGPLTVQVVLSEVGTDLSRWPSEKHFASWLGVCPDHRISGGKVLARSTRPVVSRARNALRLAAYGLERSQSALGAKYRRLKRRLGAPKAIVAMAHHLARLIWRMLTQGVEYVEQGLEAYEAKYRTHRIRWLQKQAQELNLQLVEAQ